MQEEEEVEQEEEDKEAGGRRKIRKEESETGGEEPWPRAWPWWGRGLVATNQNEVQANIVSFMLAVSYTLRSCFASSHLLPLSAYFII